MWDLISARGCFFDTHKNVLEKITIDFNEINWINIKKVHDPKSPPLVHFYPSWGKGRVLN